MFGHQWGSQQGASPNDTWVRGCADLTDKHLARGFSALLDRQSTWPPNLPEFRQLCRGGLGHQSHDPFDDYLKIEDDATKARKLAERKRGLAKLRAETGL